jgi:hypothetical protein
MAVDDLYVGLSLVMEGGWSGVGSFKISEKRTRCRVTSVPELLAVVTDIPEARLTHGDAPTKGRWYHVTMVKLSKCKVTIIICRHNRLLTRRNSLIWLWKVLRLALSVNNGPVFCFFFSSFESDTTSFDSYSFTLPQPQVEESAMQIKLLFPFIFSVRSTINYSWGLRLVCFFILLQINKKATEIYIMELSFLYQ